MNKIYLTFDDGPSNVTAPILDLLKQYKIKAMFFVLVQNTLKYPELIKREIKENHSVQLHGYDHQSFEKMDEEQTFLNINNAMDDLKKHFGVTPTTMRPPYGTVTSNLLPVLKQAKLKLMLWDIMCRDNQPRFLRNKIKYILRTLKLKPDNILCMHDGNQRWTHTGYTLQILEHILPILVQEYEFSIFD